MLGRGAYEDDSRGGTGLGKIRDSRIGTRSPGWTACAPTLKAAEITASMLR